MYYVYVIESLKDGVRYTGLTDHPERRLSEHNNGKSKFTKGHIPWKLIYTEKCSDRSSARKREVYLKSAAGRRFINKIVPGSPPA